MRVYFGGLRGPFPSYWRVPPHLPCPPLPPGLLPLDALRVPFAMITPWLMSVPLDFPAYKGFAGGGGES